MCSSESAGTTAPQHTELDRVERLKMWQSVIDRMARESANLKGWSVVLVTGVLTLLRVVNDPRLAIVAFLPLIMFFVLDSYYLGLERGFRDGFRADVAGQTDGEFLSPTVLDLPSESVWARFISCFLRGASAPITVVFYGGLVTIALLVGLLTMTGSTSDPPMRPTINPSMTATT